MPRDKSISREKIVQAAKDEFSEYGYEKASMRRIGSRCGLTAAAIYRHFDSKEAMFEDLVAPALNDMKQWISAHAESPEEAAMAALERYRSGKSLDPEERIEVRMMKELVFPKMEEFSMLINKSKGSKFENFLDDMVHEHMSMMTRYLDTLKASGTVVGNVTSEELFILLSAYCKALFEPIAHEYTMEDALKYLKTIVGFFRPGWRELLGIEQNA